MTDSRREDVLAQLLAYSREPLLAMFGELAQAAPTIEAYKAFAAKAPDRYWQAMSIAAKLAGYKDSVDINVHGLAGYIQEVKATSDAELAQRINARLLEAGLVPKALPPATTIDTTSGEPREPRSESVPDPAQSPRRRRSQTSR